MPVDLLALLSLGLGGATLVALLWGVRSMGRGPDEIHERLRRHAAVAVRSVAAEPGVEEQRLSPMGRRLVQAGFRKHGVTRLFALAKLVGAAVPPLCFVAWKAELLVASDLGVAVAAAAFGYYTPDLWLSGRVRARQMLIERSLPDCLDLLVTCVEAGQGLDAALWRVSQETRLSAPVLAQELHQTCLEVQAGIPRLEALRRLAERTGVEDLRGLAATLAQTEMFGTSVGAALRSRAEWIRTRRMQQAEERAARIAVKMTVPLVLCILPSLIAVVMGPAVVRIARALLPNLGGH